MSWISYCQNLNDSVIFNLTIFINSSEVLWVCKGSERKEMAAWVVRKCRLSIKCSNSCTWSKQTMWFGVCLICSVTFSDSDLQDAALARQCYCRTYSVLILLGLNMLAAQLWSLQNRDSVLLLLLQKCGGDLLLFLCIGGVECYDARESCFSWGDILLFLCSNP